MIKKLKEIFQPIKNYEESYEISNWGRVKSLKRYRRKFNIILKYGVDTKGYFYVNLWENGNKKIHRIAVLVWEHFGNKPRGDQGLFIDHIDNNKQNDRIDNLQLLTHRANISKGYRNKKTLCEYTGTAPCKKTNKWIARIWRDGKLRHIGYFNSAHNAHMAYLGELDKINLEV